jgi:hypothetical protein
VPLIVEAKGSGGYFYNITENFCPMVLHETGEAGYGLVETGYNSKK